MRHTYHPGCLGIKAARRALGAAALYMDDFQALIFLLLKRVLAMVGKESGTADANENTFAPYLANVCVVWET